MSGEKYVHVTERQMNRMMATCREVDQQQANNKRLRDELALAERDIKRRSREAQERHARYEKSLANVSAEMHAMDQANVRRLKEQRERFDAEFSNLGSQVASQRVEYLDLLEKQERLLRRDMDEHRAALQGQIQGLAAEIQRKEVHESERSRQWLQDTRALLAGLGEGYRHREFAPGELDDLHRELDMVEANRNQGMHQAAIASAQQTLLRGLKLRLKLELLEAEWNAHHVAALTSFRETLAYCDGLTATRFTLDAAEDRKEIDAEIDYWTEGGLSALLNQVRGKAASISSAGPGTTSLEDLKKAIGDSATERRAAEELVNKAREALILSHLRHDIAATVVDSLGGQGWAPVDSAYAGENVDGRGWRNAYHMKLSNPAKDEIVVVIEPDRSVGQGTNRVTLSYFGQSNDARLNLGLAKSVRAALSGSGLDVGEPRDVKGFETKTQGNPARLDFEGVRKSQPDKLTKGG